MKIGFIDYSFHKKTKSSIFFIKILNKKNEVITLTEDRLHYDGIDFINKNKFDLLIFWQITPNYHDFIKIKCKKVIWVPMFDSAIGINKLEWFFYKNINLNIISFCEELSKITNFFNFNTLQLKYFPEININNRKKNKKYNIFMWQRDNKIIWNKIKHKFNLDIINKVIIKNDLDPNQKILPNQEKIVDDYIHLIEGWLKKEEYDQIINEVDLYIAPREYEGIGMSFLEPMSKGIPVIAIDKPTMNEYIINNKNGFLFKKINSKEKINLNQYNKIAENLVEDIKKYRKDWKRQQNTIEHFILDVIQKPSKNTKFSFFYRFGCIYFNIKETILNIKNKIK